MINSILVVDDHDIVFRGIKLLLMKGNITADVDKAKNGFECLQKLNGKHFDIIILDVNLPDTDTQSLVTLILNKYINQKILMFSMSPEHLYARRFLKLGVFGYINKNVDSEELLIAISRLLNGQKYISHSLSDLLANELSHGLKGNLLSNLTDREFEIMQLLLKGNGNKEISNILNLHTSSVATYKNRLFTKLEVSNLVELNQIFELYNENLSI